MLLNFSRLTVVFSSFSRLISGAMLLLMLTFLDVSRLTANRECRGGGMSPLASTARARLKSRTRLQQRACLRGTFLILSFVQISYKKILQKKVYSALSRVNRILSTAQGKDYYPVCKKVYSGELACRLQTLDAAWMVALDFRRTHFETSKQRARR